jgi:hypothetical protein
VCPSRRRCLAGFPFGCSKGRYTTSFKRSLIHNFCAYLIEKIIAVLQHDGYNQQQVEEAICPDGSPEVREDVLSVCEMEILSA